MKTVIFLDDDHNRINAFRPWCPSAIIHETADMINKAIDTSDVVDVLFLDHDLGGEVFVDSNREDCGMEVVRFIEKKQPKIKHIVVHTMNPAAGEEMTLRLQKVGYSAQHVPFMYLNRENVTKLVSTI